MVAVTYGTRRVAAPSAAKKAPANKGFFQRLLDAIEASQFKRAERDIARYRYLLPEDHELRGERLVPRRPDKLPFNGR
jgi:hypothetical protein